MKSLGELFDRYLDGDLAPDELAELEAWIDQDSDHARQFIEWSATHLDTRTALQGNALHDAVMHVVERQTEVSAVESSVGGRDSRRFIYQHLVTAVCVTLLISASYFFVQKWRPEEPTPEATVQLASSGGDAKIIQRIDCVLEQDRWSIQSSEFASGESIQIAEGVVVIEFARGARVTLEGPADLEILSNNSGFLHEGKLTAVVPDSAIGFEVLTPDAHVIDHGTEFAVRVDSTGVSETHVFQGEVELTGTLAKSNTDMRPNSEILTAAQAGRFEGDETPTIKTISASPKEFIRLPQQADASSSDRSNITPLPQPSDLVMWFEASQGVQLDAESCVVSWQNLAVSDASISSGAWQINAAQRPFYRRDQTANRPAIQFQGTRKEFLATTPIRTSDEITVLVVCEFDMTPGQGVGQVLMLKGTGKLAIQQERDNSPAAQVYSWKLKELRRLQTATPTIANSPLVIGCRYSLEENLFQLFVNGELIAEDSANGPIAKEASHMIGCNNHRTKNFFSGSIAEIAVYNSLLGREKLDTAISVLMQKYAVRH